MNKFEIGKKYFDTSACDHNCVFVIEIVRRTDKTVTFIRNGNQRRAKLFFDRDGEYIIPDRYSMAPVFRATRECAPEEPSAPAQDDSADEITRDGSDNVTVLSQSADTSVVVMIFQRLFMNCGACCPLIYGTVTGFVDVPAGRFTRGGVRALVRWDGDSEHPPYVEQVKLEEIHPQGWRSANGSPLGVFIA